MKMKLTISADVEDMVEVVAALSRLSKWKEKDKHPVVEPSTKPVAEAPMTEATGPTAEWVFVEKEPVAERTKSGVWLPEAAGEPIPEYDLTPKRRGRPTNPRALKPKDVKERLKIVKEAPEKKELSMIDVRAAMTGYLAANSEEAAGKLLKTHGGGAVKLSQLAPEFYEAVYAAAVTPVVKDEDFNDEIPDLTA